MVSFVVISGVLLLSSCVVMYYVTFVMSVEPRKTKTPKILSIESCLVNRESLFRGLL